jgi:hypothetical protein
MNGNELVPYETLTVTAVNDDEAVQKAVEWRINTVTAAPIDRRTWLQVLRDGKAIYSQEIGRF